MLNEDDALRIVDGQLDAVLSGLKAPPHLTEAVLRRVRERRVSRLPEILDSIGWVAILAVVLTACLIYTPIYLVPAAMFGFGSISVIVSLAFALRSAHHTT